MRQKTEQILTMGTEKWLQRVEICDLWVLHIVFLYTEKKNQHNQECDNEVQHNEGKLYMNDQLTLSSTILT